jgi:hypothetical protein
MTPQYILISEYGNKYYYKDKQMKIRHREDGPAIEYSDGHKEWYINGERHRTDGPAVEYTDGDKSWFINDEYLTEAEFNLRTTPEIVLTLDEIAAKLGISVNRLKIKK